MKLNTCVLIWYQDSCIKINFSTTTNFLNSFIMSYIVLICVYALYFLKIRLNQKQELTNQTQLSYFSSFGFSLKMHLDIRIPSLDWFFINNLRPACKFKNTYFIFYHERNFFISDTKRSLVCKCYAAQTELN